MDAFLDKKDFEDIRLSRPVALVDLWEIDDRINQLSDIVTRLEGVVQLMGELYKKDQIKKWEVLIEKLMNFYEKRGCKDDKFRRLKNDL